MLRSGHPPEPGGAPASTPDFTALPAEFAAEARQTLAAARGSAGAPWTSGVLTRGYSGYLFTRRGSPDALILRDPPRRDIELSHDAFDPALIAEVSDRNRLVSDALTGGSLSGRIRVRGSVELVASETLSSVPGARRRADGQLRPELRESLPSASGRLFRADAPRSASDPLECERHVPRP